MTPEELAIERAHSILSFALKESLNGGEEWTEPNFLIGFLRGTIREALKTLAPAIKTEDRKELRVLETEASKQ